jgi:hypothetical protein
MNIQKPSIFCHFEVISPKYWNIIACHNELIINMIINLHSISQNEYAQRFAKEAAGLVWEGWPVIM